MIESALNGSDMVLAIRTDANNSMLWHQKLGTKAVLLPINLFFRQKVRDISPFRLVKSSIFTMLQMSPKKFRWPSELLVKSLAIKLTIDQIDVVSLPREGTSTVSGNIKNSLRAGLEMLSSLQFIRYNNKHKRSTLYATEKQQ
jgi:hypothetical protein